MCEKSLYVARRPIRTGVFPEVPEAVPDDIYNIESCPGVFLRLAYNAVTRIQERALSTHGVGSIHFFVIAILVQKGPITSSDLCRIIDYDQGSMSEVVAQMRKRGWIKQVRSKSDRRAKIILITPAGSSLYSTLRQSVSDTISTSFAGFSAVEKENLNDRLKQIIRNIPPRYNVPNLPPPSRQRN